MTDDRDRTALLDRLEYVAERFAWRVHAYCVMDNHLHLVVQTLEPTLGVGMQRLVGGHAFAFNRRHRRAGHLFAGPYYAATVETEAHLIEACVYVVLNPVRAGVVESAADWRWSSSRATAGLEPMPRFVASEVLPNSLSCDPRAAHVLYRQIVHEVAHRPPAGSG